MKEHPELPPLTDELLIAFEKRTGLKLPVSLVELLRTKNGGIVENSDFKFRTGSYNVAEIEGVCSVENFSSIRSYAFILDGEDTTEIRDTVQKKLGDLSKVLNMADSGGYPYGFALNYNHLNSAGEPTVYCIWLEYDNTDAHLVANSFGDFLNGQYFGDAKPIVNLDEARKYKLIAEGGYEGRYDGVHEEGSLLLAGLPVRVSWKIYSHWNRIIVFQESDWAGKKEITKAEVQKSALCFEFKSLESYGVELEADFAELIRPAVEVELLTEFDAPIAPKCYELFLHILLGEKRQVALDTSELYEGRWKNQSQKLVCTSVKSSDKATLGKTLEAVAASCVGWRRFLG